MTTEPTRFARHALARLAPLLAALGLAGCAAGNGYPSLAPRAVEGSAAAAAAPPQSAPADPALDARVASLAAQAAAGHAAFEKTAAQACAGIARGARAAAGSEPWIAAQQAISALDAARAPVLAAVAELDRLVIERGTAAGPAVDLSRLAAAQERASAIDMAEQATVVTMSAGNCAG